MADSGGLPGDPFLPPKLYHYWSVHLREPATPSFCVDVTGHLETKLAAVRCYESQVVVGRDPTFPSLFDDIESPRPLLGLGDAHHPRRAASAAARRSG